MRFGIVLPHFRAVAGAAAIRDVAQAADSLGFDSIWITDRAAIPRGEVNRRFGPAFYDPLVTLGYVAACTTRVRLGATVFVLPFRHPVLMARAIASLDQLCGGRLDVGVGTGWMREEFDAIGVPFEQRGALTDEYLDAMIALWSAPVASFAGPTVRFENLHAEPLPVQQPHPPIWVGGRTPPAYRRAIKYGQVWHASPVGLSELLPAIAGLRETAKRLGRDPETIALTTRAPLYFELTSHRFGESEPPEMPIGTPDAVLATLRRYQAAGFSEIVFDTFFAGFPELEGATPDGILQTMSQFTRVVRPAFP
ncbi:MAG TPA: LLM class F420-dependent oxidoreductase [Dehalococcoidia bacterium]|nr:LLM class F420-dependent oxidoreductase [Dehalococcoidia bacterium]